MIKTPKRNNKKRLAIISLVIFVLLGCVAAGFLFWENSQSSNLDNDDTQQIPEEPSEPKQIESERVLDDDSLSLEEWGIKFTIPDSLKDTSIKYSQKVSNDAPPRESYVFTTSRIQAIGEECMKSPFGDTVHLSRFTEDPGPHPHSLWASQGMIDGYFYTLSSPIAGCSMINENEQAVNSVSQVEINDRAALVELVKTLKSSK